MPELREGGDRLRFVGRQDSLPRSVLAAIKEAEKLTRDNGRFDVYVALAYGGRSEIVDATQRVIAAGLEPEEVDEASFARNLYAPEAAEVDLLRTGGELRIPNALLWQMAYAEFYVTEAPWPDFSPGEFLEALAANARRSRRWGRA